MIVPVVHNEKELLLLIAKSDEIAFRQLFDAYRSKLYSYVLKITESKETAEDTVHDVFLKLWTQRDKITEVQNINAYLYRMSHNHAYNGLRRMAKKTLIMAELERDSISGSNDADEKLISNEVKQFIHKGVSKLTRQQREVFKMSREYGLKQEEIAQRLGISVLTVKKHLTEALNSLRKEISTSFGRNAMALYIVFYVFS